MEHAIEPATYLRYLLVLAFVLALIWGLAWLLKRVSRLNFGLAVRAKHEKLQIQEILSIDGRTKLVRFQYEEQDYVIVMGQNYALKVVSPDSTAIDTVDAANIEADQAYQAAPATEEQPSTATIAAALHGRQEPSMGYKTP